jgi:hypothetical protein
MGAFILGRGAIKMAAGAVLFTLVATTGCGGPGFGSISGTVSYKGNKLPGGLVTVVHPDGRIGEGKIGEDGTFSIPSAPAGDVKVLVTTAKPLGPTGMLGEMMSERHPFNKQAPKSTAPRRTGGPPIGPLGPYVPIPMKYAGNETTPLTLTLGRNEHKENWDIELKD